MAASSGTGGTPAEADEPAMLAAESELLEALDRLSTADSDAAWQEAVNARNVALRRLMRACSELPLDEADIVFARATHAAARDRLRAQETRDAEPRLADMPDKSDLPDRDRNREDFPPLFAPHRPFDDGPQ